MSKYVLALAAFALSSTFAFAQQRQCASREIVLERLAEAYGESRQSIGIAANNLIVETFASLKTGTWTIVATSPAGLTCLIASGQSFENLAEEVAPTGDPT